MAHELVMKRLRGARGETAARAWTPAAATPGRGRRPADGAGPTARALRRGGGRSAARPADQFAAAVRAHVLHRRGAGGTKRALVATDPRARIVRQRRRAALAAAAHLQRHQSGDTS